MNHSLPGYQWMLIHWSDEDEALAVDEDWGLFDDVGGWCVRRRFIDLVVTGEDISTTDPWKTLMSGETLTHDKARNFIRDYAPEEWGAMLRYTQFKPGQT